MNKCINVLFNIGDWTFYHNNMYNASSLQPRRYINQFIIKCPLIYQLYLQQNEQYV